MDEGKQIGLTRDVLIHDKMKMLNFQRIVN